MTQLNSPNKHKAGLAGVIFGGLLIGIPATPFAASAAPAEVVLNPCPKIYYEEPFNSRNLVPESCPPNAITRQYRANSKLPGKDLTPNAIVPADAPTIPGQVISTPGEPGVAIVGETPGVTNPPGTATTPPVKPPLPEVRANAIANIMPMNGKVDVKLKNKTNALVTYEAIGYTGRRTLPGGAEIVLRNLPVPVTITTVRQDKGLVDVIPISNKKGMLDVSLQEDKSLDDNAGVLRIQKDSQVFLN